MTDEEKSGFLDEIEKSVNSSRAEYENCLDTFARGASSIRHSSPIVESALEALAHSKDRARVDEVFDQAYCAIAMQRNNLGEAATSK
ncbi:MAG: hypothetical protein J6U54_09520 [Clostridiales bacterium]|nr:hypothetical protein [Clostridiales bacterium]